MNVARLVAKTSNCIRLTHQTRSGCRRFHRLPQSPSHQYCHPHNTNSNTTAHRSLSSATTSSPLPASATEMTILDPANTSTNPLNPNADRYSLALTHNKEWAVKTSQEDPGLFPAMATGQSPQILWIGCSDARCPETTLLGLKPGDVFVHRNIGNVLHPADLSSAAVVEYAVAHLKVKHIVLCGHTCCGGVAAALGNKQLGILDPWLFPLRQIREENLGTLQSLSGGDLSLKMTELNVLAGVKTLKQKAVVLNAIQDRGLQVHGLIFDVGSGMLRELETGEPEEVVKARLVSFKTE